MRRWVNGKRRDEVEAGCAGEAGSWKKSIDISW